MELSFWNERWQRGETGFHQQNLNPYLCYFYGEKGPAPEARHSIRVFVPLCGKTLDMQWLCRNGYSVVGVECSPVAVEQFFAENSLEHRQSRVSEFVSYQSDAQPQTRNRLEILQGDFFRLTRPDLGKVTDVFDRASLIALPREMRTEYVKKMTEIQEPGTRTLLITLTYPQHEMDGPPFSVDEQEVQDLYSDNFTVEKLLVKNILEREPRFRERGLTSLVETAYKLTRK